MSGIFKTDGGPTTAASTAAFKKGLNKVYTWYTGGFLTFLIVLAIAEQMGLSRQWIGMSFLAATVLLYAGIGFITRTTDADEYYVAGRRVPALYNGMATGADWMSAASFIGMAGTLYLSGYDGLAFIMGWTGGYCLVALFLAPYMRKFGQFTIPDFLGERYGGHIPRFIGVVAAILCSFTYVVAQIYGVGLITARLAGVEFEVGIFLGLSGILVCSLLGGMRAVTWTQVAQYIILIVAYMIPVVWLSVKQTSIPVPQAIYGYQLEKVTAKEKLLTNDPKELEVRAIFKQRSADLAEKLKDPAAALAVDKATATTKVADLKAANAPAAELAAAEKALSSLPIDAAAAKVVSVDGLRWGGEIDEGDRMKQTPSSRPLVAPSPGPAYPSPRAPSFACTTRVNLHPPMPRKERSSLNLATLNSSRGISNTFGYELVARNISAVCLCSNVLAPLIVFQKAEFNCLATLRRKLRMIRTLGPSSPSV